MSTIVNPPTDIPKVDDRPNVTQAPAAPQAQRTASRQVPIPAGPPPQPTVFTIKFKNGHTQQFQATKEAYQAFVKALIDEKDSFYFLGSAVINLKDVSCILPK